MLLQERGLKFVWKSVLCTASFTELNTTSIATLTGKGWTTNAFKQRESTPT